MNRISKRIFQSSKRLMIESYAQWNRTEWKSSSILGADVWQFC